MLNSILNNTAATSVTLPSLLLCILASLVIGVGIALIYMYKNVYSKNFVITLALLPAMVQIVIMLVNGNLGTGIAVMGAFSLVRFRSVPGSAREIGSICHRHGVSWHRPFVPRHRGADDGAFGEHPLR